jgi:hypothetical protein
VWFFEPPVFVLLINFRDKMIYASSFLKIFGIAEVLVLDFRKLTESQKLWFQFFEKKNTIIRRTSSFGFILRTADQGSELVLCFSGNRWSRVPCTQPYTLVLYLQKERTTQHWFIMEDKRNTDFKWDLFCRTQN